MKLISEATTLIITIFLISIAFLLTLIGLTTPLWLKDGYGLWSCDHVCSTASTILTILALILIATSLTISVIRILHLFSRKLLILPAILLIIATYSLLASMGSYLRDFDIIGYSFELILTAHALCLAASILLAFWLGRISNENINT